MRKYSAPALLLLLAAALFLPRLGSHQLWNPDEPRVAEIAREMMGSGEYLVPRLNGEIYSHKPPLMHWSVCLAAWICGDLDETAVRLPSALSAIGSVLVVFGLGARLYSRRVGWMSAAIFATSFRILWQGRFGQIDMMLIFFVTLSLYFWVRGFVEERVIFYRLFFLATGLATLTKGPVGLIPPLLTTLVFLAATRELKQLGKMRPFLGLGIWAAVVLLWLIPAGIAGGWDYLFDLVYRQNVTRFANPWHHIRPWYYYMTTIPLDFSPWTLFLPASLWLGWRQKEPETRRTYLFSLCWVLTTLIFFSLSSGKRSVYVLTMVPGLALLTGAFLDKAVGLWPRWRLWLLYPLGGLVVLMTLGAIALPIVAYGQNEAELFPPTIFLEAGLCLMLIAAGGMAAFMLSRRGRPELAVVTVVLGMLAGSHGFIQRVVPPFDEIRGTRAISETLSHRMGPTERYGIYPRQDARLIFYTERLAEDLFHPNLVERFTHDPERVWILARKDHLHELESIPSLHEVERDQNPWAGYALLTNLPMTQSARLPSNSNR